MTTSLYVNVKQNGEIEICTRSFEGIGASDHSTVHRVTSRAATHFARDFNRAIEEARVKLVEIARKRRPAMIARLAELDREAEHLRAEIRKGET